MPSSTYRRAEHGYRRDISGVLHDHRFWTEGDPDAQRRVLTELADDPRAAIRTAAVEHPMCPPDALASRLADEDLRVACSAALHPALPPSTAGEAQQPDPEATRATTRRQTTVLWALALNTAMPENVRHQCVRAVFEVAPHMKSRIPEFVARLDRNALVDGGNPGAEPGGSISWSWWVIERLAVHPDIEVMTVAVKALFRSAGLDEVPLFGYESWREHLLTSPVWQIRGAIAEHVRDADVLDRLAGDESVLVRRRVAKNPAVSAAAITQLLGDADGRVRRAATDRLGDALRAP